MLEYKILLERYGNRHLNTLQLVRFSYLIQDVRENDEREVWLDLPYRTLLIRVGGQEDGITRTLPVSYYFLMEPLNNPTYSRKSLPES